ncbi:hypothetical protein [Enhygromyxa salina]|nr:hypothetical protein [Enhygromyxa salina]
MPTRAWTVLSVSLSLGLGLGLGGCKHEAPVVSEPVRAGAEPTGVAPAIIVEAPPQPIGCQATTPSGGMLLVPEAAQWLVRIEPAQVMNSGFWSVLGAKVEAGELSELFAGLRECGIEPAALRDVFVGFNPTTEDFVLIMQGPAIGQPEQATCAVQVMRRQLPGEQAVEVEASLSPGQFGGPPTIPFDDGVAYLISPDELVLTSRGWQHEVAQLAQCMGRPALQSTADASLARLISRVDTHANAWAIGRLPPEVTSMFMMIGLASGEPYDLTVMLDFSSGLGFDLNLSVDAAASAEQGRATVQGMLDEFAASGEPSLQQFAAGIHVEANGPSLRIHGWYSPDQLLMLRDQI